MSVVIRTEAVTRRFGHRIAVDGVNLTLSAGQVYGFLGRNGAGKTTLIRMLLGLIRPSAGTVTVLGHDVGSHVLGGRPWKRVGYVVESPGLYPELTVLDHLQLAATYHSLTPAAVSEVVERLQLTRDADVAARHLSLGNRQRLALALALVHSPEVLILDEPANSLDPAGVVEIRDLLRELADNGAAVFMSSHIVTEVARTADQIGIIHDGRLVEELTASDLSALGSPHLQATLPHPEQAQAAVAALHAANIHAEPRAAVVVSYDSTAVEHPELVATLLVGAGTAPRSLVIQQQDLEQHFLELTGGATG